MESIDFARLTRITTLQMIHRAKASHIGSAYSMADILAVLYGPGGQLNVRPEEPTWADRDRFILSKGHACAGLYATLAHAGFFKEADLSDYAMDGSDLMAHASHKVPGVELSTGSLGHGLPVGCGLAYGARLQNHDWRTVVLLSDGEMDEGSNWEALLFAAHHGLDRLWAIVDANKIQSLGTVQEVMALEPLAAKFEAFGWAVKEIDGHDHSALRDALTIQSEVRTGKPTAVIARTVKGKGVTFMEDSLAWHYQVPDDQQLLAAISQLRGN